MSNSIRKASSLGQNQRAKKFPLTDPDDPDQKDLTPQWIDVYSGTIKREFPGLAEGLRKRLAQSIVSRRKRILSRRSRHQRWALQQESDTRRGASEAIQIPQKIVQTTSADSVTGREEIKPAAPATRTNAPSQLTATTLQPELLREPKPPSTVSSSAVTASPRNQDKIFVPPPPRAAKEGKDFVCPYCCIILPSIEGTDRRRWL